MKKDWHLYAHHIIDCINKIKHIKSRGDITTDDVLYDDLAPKNRTPY